MSPTGTMVSDISDDGDDSDGNMTNDPTITITNAVPPVNSSIEVTKTAFVSDNGDGVNGLGDTIIYTIRVANTGDTILSNVNLNDSLTDLNGAIMSLTNGPIFINASLGSGVGTLAI